MIPYADTNFFTRAYLNLPESGEADRLLATAVEGRAQPLPVTWLHRVETVNAFQLHVFFSRASGQPRVTLEQAALALANYREDLQRATFLNPVAIAVTELEHQFEELSLRHTALHGFRTYDLLHVASALMLKCDSFWSFDDRTSRLAGLEGLKVRH
ncbi:MAG: type II toxin-antitoxin system VapC family toxin [Verrucomicrobiota bacterium]|jgi:predicted nucleic acid-binding protein